MHHHIELSFVDEFRWVLPLHHSKNGWQNAVLIWCMLQAGPPSLHYYCAVVLHSCIVLPPVGHSSNHDYHCCQLKRQWSCASNFYRNFKVFIWLTIVLYVWTHDILRRVIAKQADRDGQAVYGVGIQLLDCWDCGFESGSGDGSLSFVFVFFFLFCR